jgi:hypothetical protein
MTAHELIKTIQHMTAEERREFGIALERCGVTVVLTKTLGSVHKTNSPTIASEPERRPWIDTYASEE